MHISEQFTFPFEKEYLVGDKIVINGDSEPLLVEEVLDDRLMVRDWRTEEVYSVMLNDCRRANELDYL
jgi:hypothetical protein